MGLSRELNMFMSHYKEKRRDTRELREGRERREGWGVEGLGVLWALTGKLDDK